MQSPELGELEQARVWLTQEGIAVAPRVLAVLAQVPNLESNEPAQAMLADVIAVSLDGCERGELAEVISTFEDCPVALAKVALALLTAAFFPDQKIVPAKFDDSAVLCFSLFVAVAGKPFEALDLIDLAAKERKGERFATNAALLRMHIESKAGSSLPLSVIVPSYKGDDWILDGLDSLAEQSLPWSKYEVIVVVNGPRTRTPELIQEWLSRHPGFPLKVIVTEKAGAAYARNIGLDAAQGEYVVFMDDDDRAGHSMLEALLRHAAPDVVSMVPVGFVTDNWQHPQNDNWCNRSILPLLGRISPWQELRHSGLHVAGKAWFRERALLTRFNEDLRTGEDFVFTLNYVNVAPSALAPVALGRDSSYLWWHRPGSLSVRAADMNDWDKHVQPWLKVIKALAAVKPTSPAAAALQKYMVPKVVDTFLKAYLQRHPEDMQRMVDALTERGVKVV
ncbi:glycosyltransferase family 2 protein [Thermomonas brevis]